MKVNFYILEMAEIMYICTLLVLNLTNLAGQYFVISVILIGKYEKRALNYLSFFDSQSLSQQQSKHSATYLPNRFFYHPDSWWSHDQLQIGSFSHQQGRGGGRGGREIEMRLLSRALSVLSQLRSTCRRQVLCFY